jgi:MFS family permease
VVSEKERGWAVALFDSGSSIGGALAPLLVIGLYKYFGGWRPAFVITGTLGFLWLGGWRMLYYPPESHPRIGAAEREMILRDRVEMKEDTDHSQQQARWRDLIKLPQTWAIIAARTMTDPVWFSSLTGSRFSRSKGINPEQDYWRSGFLSLPPIWQLFRRWTFLLVDQPRMAGHKGSSCNRVWRPGHDTLNSRPFYFRLALSRSAVRSFNFRLRLAFPLWLLCCPQISQQ